MLPKYVKNIYIIAGFADSAPPLGTILGNLGVNTTNFCTSFNLYTKKLPDYYIVKTQIKIFENRSTEFSIDFPSVGCLLNLFKYEKIFKIKVYDRYHEKVKICINLTDILKLAKFKFRNLNLANSFLIIKGSVKSRGYFIINNIYDYEE